MGEHLTKDQITAMRASTYHKPHFEAARTVKNHFLSGVGFPALETGLFHAKPGKTEVKVEWPLTHQTGDCI